MPAMIVRFYQGWFQMLLFDFPLFTASTFSIAVFYLMAERELYPKAGGRHSLSAFPDVAGHRPHSHQHNCGDGALFGIKSPFVRTPKYRVAKKGEKSQAASTASG